MRVWPCLGLLAAICACSTFSESPADGGALEDAGAEAEAAPVDAAADNERAPDASVDPATCVSFGGNGGGVPADWTSMANVTGGLGTSSVDSRACMEGRVKAAGERATATRDLTIPASGQLTVTVDLHLEVASSGNVGWLVNVVTVACSTPVMQVSLEITPGGALAVEAAPPASPPSAVFLGTANMSGLATLRLAFGGGTNVVVDYGGMNGSVDLSAPIMTAKGCVLTVGASASGNIPSVTASIAEVCVSSP